MPRKKQTKPEDTPTVSLDGHAVLEALRSNLALLGELAARYEVAYQPQRPAEMPAINCPQEQIRVLLLNTRNQVMAQRVVYQGNVNSSIVRPAEVFRPAIVESATSIVIGHNQPSGDPTPSPEDLRITRDLAQAGKLLGIDLLDHVVAGGGHVSLREKGLMDG